MVDAISTESFVPEDLELDETIEKKSNIQEAAPLSEAEAKRKHELILDLLQLGNELVAEVEKDKIDEKAISGNVQKFLTMLQFAYERFASEISKEDKRRIKELKKQATDASKDQGKEILKKSTIALAQGVLTLALALATGAAPTQQDSKTFEQLGGVVGTAASFFLNRYEAANIELGNKVRQLQTELDNKSQKSTQDGGKTQVQQAVDAKRQAERQAHRYA